MALNLSKLKNTVQPENNTNKTNFSKLNLNGLKKQAESNKDSVESTTLNSVSSIVDKAWGEKINSIPAPVDNSNSSNDLDIPSFLRKNRGIK